MSTRDDILDALENTERPKLTNVPAPWDRLFLQTVGVDPLLDFETQWIATDASSDVRPDNTPALGTMIAASLVDEAGETVMGKAEAFLLAKKNGALFMKIARQVMTLHGLTGESQKDAEKNLEAVPAADSSSS